MPTGSFKRKVRSSWKLKIVAAAIESLSQVDTIDDLDAWSVPSPYSSSSPYLYSHSWWWHRRLLLQSIDWQFHFADCE